jgi:hypothetical protein
MEKIKNNSSFLSLMITITVLLVLLWVLVIKPKMDASSLKKGQTYEWVIDDENPFIKPKVVYFRILDVKDDYVLYYDSIWGDTSSMRVNVFMWDAKRIK